VNTQSDSDDIAQVRVRVVTGVLVVAAVLTWGIAAMLVWVVAPLLRTGATLAESPEGLPLSVLAVAVASSGLVLFVGQAVNWFAPRRGAGRAVLLIGGLMVAMSGAQHSSSG
jgi:hypothetical protein